VQATDIRIAAEHATFGLSEAKRALVPAGGLPRCAHAIGMLR
jgi:enoyl-CoA hydratase/carnithine racemase